MKILNTQQIRDADQYTIQHEPITSIDLMERASGVFVDWFTQKFPKQKQVKIFCGIGNNGGDGLCIARMLHQIPPYRVQVYIVRFSEKTSEDFAINYKRLLSFENIPVMDIKREEDFPVINENDVLIDAIFGSGLSRPVSGFTAKLIQYLNQSFKRALLAVDIPSGLFADKTTNIEDRKHIIQATNTLSFEVPKLAFLFPQNEKFTGNWEVLSIQLHPTFLEEVETVYFYVTDKEIRNIIKPKSKFQHKGKNGHSLLIAGSYGKMGACVLASKACIKAGSGLLTTYIPKCGYVVLQTAIPETMCLTDKEEKAISDFPYLYDNQGKAKYQAIGIGPGLGSKKKTQKALKLLLKTTRQPLVLDADALNIIAKNKWLDMVPENSILTPHPKEFERLAGTWTNEFERLEKVKTLAKKYKIIIVLKGAYTAIVCPKGKVYFNSTGNPALATGGSGDILTGMITGFLAQGYTSIYAALLGVYYHGRAGDLAIIEKGNTLLAREIIDFIRL